MRTNRSRQAAALAVCATLWLFAGCDSSEQSSVTAASRDANLSEDSVKRIIEESPNEYLAAVQEVVDDSDCYGEKDGSGCLLRVRVVEYIGGEPGRPVARQEGWVYQTIEMRMDKPWPNREIGRRRLVLAIPHPSKPDIYGNRVFVVDPSPEEVAMLRRVLKLAQTQTLGGRLG